MLPPLAWRLPWIVDDYAPISPVEECVAPPTAADARPSPGRPATRSPGSPEGLGSSGGRSPRPGPPEEPRPSRPPGTQAPRHPSPHDYRGRVNSVRGWRNATFVAFAIMGVAVSTLLARLPAVRDHLDIDAGAVGTLLAGFATGSLIGLACSAPLLTRFGPVAMSRRTVPIAGGMLVAVGAAASVLEQYWVTVAFLALFGATLSLSDVAINVVGAANERALRKTVMPLFHAGFSIGSVLGAGAAAAAEAIDIPVWAHLAVGGALVIGVGLVAIRWFPSTFPDAPTTPPDRDERRNVWRDPRTYLVGLLVLGFGYAEGSATDWLPIALVDDRGLDHATAALLLTVFMVAMTTMRLAGGPLVDRLGRVPVLLGAATVAVVGLASVIFIPDPVATVVGVVLWGLGSALGFPLGMSAAADDPATATARVSAVATVGYFAFLVGPVLVGFVGEQVRILSALTIVLGLLVLAGAVSPAARERRTAPTVLRNAFLDPSLPTLPIEVIGDERDESAASRQEDPSP